MSGPVDPSDPRVRQLAYNMYRDMLGACHGRSSDMVSRAPQGKQVVQDKGVHQQIVSMAQQKTSASAGNELAGPSFNNITHSSATNNGTASISATNGSANAALKTNGFATTNSVPTPFTNGSAAVNGSTDRADGAERNGTNGTADGAMHRIGVPPPPPPPPPPGGVGSGYRAQQQTQQREAPAVIQNAMATKDKKPFSYLPVGGIDLSEIKSHPIQKKISVPEPAPAPIQGQTFTAPTVAPPAKLSAAQGHLVPMSHSGPVSHSVPMSHSAPQSIANNTGAAPKQPSVGSAWEQNLARQRSAAPPSAPFGEKVALASTSKRASPPRSVPDGAAPATVAMAANPPWRVTRKQSFPAPASNSQTAATNSNEKQTVAPSSVRSAAPASGQARGQLYIPPVSKPEPVAEALPSPPVHLRNTPPSWQQTKARAESPLVAKTEDVHAPQWRLAKQVQKQASQPSGMGREANVGVGMQHDHSAGLNQSQSPQSQSQSRQQPQRQHSLSSERTIPVQLVTGPDGQPHISIGGRLLPVTADGVQLPMGLILPEVEKGRLIQEVARRQSNRPPAPPPVAARPRQVPYNVPKDSAGDPIPSMRSLQLSEEDKRLVSAFREQDDSDQTDSSQEGSLYKGSHIPSRLFRSLERTVSGATAPPSRIGGPGQGRAVIVNMKPGRPGGSAVPTRQEEAQPQQKRNPSRSFRVLQQMTAEQQDS